MAIDISNLSQEKRAFLKAHPELLKSLEQTIPRLVAGIQKRKEKLKKTKAKWQRDLEDVDRRVADAQQRADELRHEADLMRMQRLVDPFGKFSQPSISTSELVCPVCLEGDKGNKMNGKSWCIKCNSSLIPKDKVEKWKRLPNVKVLSKSLEDELHRLNPGLKPDNKEVKE